MPTSVVQGDGDQNYDDDLVLWLFRWKKQQKKLGCFKNYRKNEEEDDAAGSRC